MIIKRINMTTFLILLLHSLFILKINGDNSLSELFKMTTSDKIKEEGYNVEEHTVTTEDGYLLTMHRIPGKSDVPAILIQHGTLSSSFDFVVMGKNKSLAFILADHGYDVWLGNSRGNTYSRRHVRLDSSNPRFWNFSFHEMGIYDLSAEISYISNLKNDSIFYVGHSMGTTISYIMAIRRPDIADKVKIIFSFAPAAFLGNSKAPYLIFPPYLTEDLVEKLQIHEFLPQNFLTRTILKYYCNSVTIDNICAQFLFLSVGSNLAQFNFTLMPLILSHDPAGSSVKTGIHYLQLAATGKFQEYDYRPRGNKMMYNSTEPPQYDITKIKVPLGLFWSDNDRIVVPKDVQLLYDLLPKNTFSYQIPDPLFTHNDFLWATNAPTVVYSKLLEVMKYYK